MCSAPREGCVSGRKGQENGKPSGSEKKDIFTGGRYLRPREPKIMAESHTTEANAED